MGKKPWIKLLAYNGVSKIKNLVSNNRISKIKKNIQTLNNEIKIIDKDIEILERLRPRIIRANAVFDTIKSEKKFIDYLENQNEVSKNEINSLINKLNVKYDTNTTFEELPEIYEWLIEELKAEKLLKEEKLKELIKVNKDYISPEIENNIQSTKQSVINIQN